MKKIILFLLMCSAALGQNSRKVANTVLGIQKEKKHFTEYSIFTPEEHYAGTEYKKSVSKATIATLDLSAANKIVAESNNNIELKIPYLGQVITVLLYKVDIQAEGFQVDTDKQKNVPCEKGAYYRGIIENDMNSLVSFNFFHNQVNGIVSTGSLHNLVIGKLAVPGNLTDYIIYSDNDILNKKSFNCDTADVLPKMPKSTIGTDRNSLTQHCVTVYFEIEYSMYEANGSNVNQTNIWMNSVFNNVQTLYNNDGITVAIKSMFIWTAQDPYQGDESYEYLMQFHEVRPIFNGDIGQLIGIDQGLGGVAITIDGLCSENNFSYADVYYDYETVPTMSWTVEVITHELGHLMGSPHTHGCYWNGNDTAIDGCGTLAGYVEGDCPIGDIPSPLIGGTIMSYCHLIEDVGINFANGFGPQPAARIVDAVGAAQCLSSDCISTCISQVANINTADVSYTSAAVSWTDMDSSDTQWEISVTTYPYEPVSWITTTSNPYIINGLTPNTIYNVCVRPVCPSGLMTTSRSTYFTTTDDFCAGKQFTDTGGPDHIYTDNENWVRTVAPINPDNKIKVVFNNVDIEYSYDFLYVFNGASTESPLMTPDGITGTGIPGPFVSTDASGALTFRFISDEYVTGAGWDASFSCLDLGLSDADFIDFSYYPNPVKNDVSINSKNEIENIAVYSIDGKLLYENAAKAFDTKIDMSGYAAGTYIVKLQFGNKPVAFKVVKQ